MSNKNLAVAVDSFPLEKHSKSWVIYLSLAIVTMSFTATGPVAIIIAAAREGGLSQAELSSWLFAVFFINGVISIVLSWWTKQPLAFLWTIPGTILAAPVIARYGLDAVAGVYLVCAGILVILGVTKLIVILDRLVPAPVVMGMISALFVKYTAAIAHATLSSPVLGGIMLCSYFLLLRLEKSRGYSVMPPILGALLAGGVTLFVTGISWPSGHSYDVIALPAVIRPVFNMQAIIELSIPLLVTILFVQNAQGLAVLREVGYRPSSRLVTITSGIFTAVCAPFGACPSVLAGPSNAILVSAGSYGKHYIAGIIAGIFCIIAGIFANGFTHLVIALPPEYIAILAGLAMLIVLEKSFKSAFSSALPLSATVTFAVTISDIMIAGIGAPAWGILIGSMLAFLVEKKRDRVSV